MDTINGISVLLSKISVAVGLLSVAAAQVPSVEYVVVPPPNKFPNQASIRNYIAEMAKVNNLPVYDVLFTVEHESRFNPNAIGDTDKKCKDGSQMRSRGLWQIQNCAWPEVTDEMAFDVVASTKWGIQKFKENPNIFSAYRFRKVWFKDYNPQ